MFVKRIRLKFFFFRKVLTPSIRILQWVGPFPNFWPRFYIVVLGMTFCFRFFNQFTFSNLYLDFYFPFLFGLLFPFFLWTFIFPFLFGLWFLFSLLTFISLLFPFYFPFFFWLFFSLFSLDSIAVTFWISSKFFTSGILKFGTGTFSEIRYSQKVWE